MSAAPGRGGAEGEGPVDAARSRLEQEGMKARGVAWEAEAAPGTPNHGSRFPGW